MKTKGMRAALAALGMAALALAGCGGGSSNGDTQVRLVNASSGYAVLDFYVDDGKVASSVAYGQASEYSDVSEGSHTTSFSSSGSTAYLLSTSRSLTKNVPLTLLTYGWQGGLKTVTVSDTESTPASGKAKLLVYNTAPDAGSVDVYLSGSDEDIGNATLVASSVAGGSSASSGYVTLAAGTYRVRITGAGSTTDIRLDAQGLTLGSAQVALLVVTPTASGVLTNALSVVQGGAVTAFNTTSARARVVSAVSNNGSVSVKLGSTTLASASNAPAIGSYTSLTAGTLAPTVSVNGSTLAVADQTLAAGGDYTLLVWGSASAPKFSLISDDNRLPTSTTKAKLRVLDGLSDTAAALTLTADYSVVAEGVAQGAASSFGSLNATTLSNLAVLSSAGTLYSTDSVTLASQGVYTLFMLGTSSTPVAVMRKER